MVSMCLPVMSGDLRVDLMFYNLMCVECWFRWCLDTASATFEFSIFPMIAAKGKKREPKRAGKTFLYCPPSPPPGCQRIETTHILCLLNAFSEKKVFSHISQFLGSRFSWCLLMWNASEYFDWSTLPQTSHGNGVTGLFVCFAFSWRFSPSLWRNFMPHCSHWYGFSPVSAWKWDENRGNSEASKIEENLRRRMWNISDLLCVKAFGHTLHAYGRSPVWMN